MSLSDMDIFSDEIGVVTSQPKRKYNKKPVSTFNPMILIGDDDELVAPDMAFINRDPIDQHLAKLHLMPDVIFNTLRVAGFHAWLEGGYKNAIIPTNFNKYKDTKLVDDGFLAVLSSGSGSDKEAMFKYLLVHGSFDETTFDPVSKIRVSKTRKISHFLLNKKKLELLAKYKISQPIGPSMLK